MIKYSVIVPVYNAQSTLERCLDSLVKQKRSDVEVLVINDGSQDGSSKICRSFAEKFPCIKLFEKANGGVSSARNLGLDNMHGEYVLFVDSDDYVGTDYFSTLDLLLSDGDPELAMFGVRYFGRRDYSPELAKGAWRGEQATDILCSWVHSSLFFSLWSKVFRSDIIEKYGIRFDETLSISEDVVFIFSYAVHAVQVACSADTLYFVNEENGQSLSRKPIDDLAWKLSRALELMHSALTEAELSEYRNRRFSDALVYLNYRSAFSASKQTKTIEDPFLRRKAIREICCKFSTYPERPHSVLSLLLAIPIRLKMTHLIDGLIQRKK